MEGYNPTLGCAAGCFSCSGWTPYPKAPTRRDALLDAVGRTDNPCERPSRNGPCCNPMPKFRRPREKPECDINCYRQEECESKQRDACEEYQRFVKHCCPPQSGPIIEALSPDHPVQVQYEEEVPPEQQYVLQEVQCRTNIIAGFFNPDDNKTVEQKLKEQCDQTYLSCGPNLPMYPCRGVIQYPPLSWTRCSDEFNKCNKFICQGTKYCDPSYLEQQRQEMRRKECEKLMEAERSAMEEEFRNRYFNPNAVDPCCANQKLSLTPYCNCGCDMSP